MSPPFPPFVPPFAITVAPKPSDKSWKVVLPPAAPGLVAPLLIMIARLACEVPVKTMAPGSPPAKSAGATMKVCVVWSILFRLEIPKPVKVIDVPAGMLIL